MPRITLPSRQKSIAPPRRGKTQAHPVDHLRNIANDTRSRRAPLRAAILALPQAELRRAWGELERRECDRLWDIVRGS
jgi:hypothetical protein